MHTTTMEELMSEHDPLLIVGSCLGGSNPEKALAEAHKRILFAMVGPDIFYEDQLPHVFGMHLSSYRYDHVSLIESSDAHTSHTTFLSPRFRSHSTVTTSCYHTE